MTQPRTRSVARSLLLAGALSACGGASPPAAAPEPLTSTTVAGALVEFDRAEGQLRVALGGSGYASPVAPQEMGAVPAPAQAAPPPPPPAPQAESQGEARSASKSAGADNGVSSRPPDPCATACRALASMSRAAEHLCGLSGEDDARCSGARGRVKAASERVKAECPSCSG